MLPTRTVAAWLLVFPFAVLHRLASLVPIHNRIIHSPQLRVYQPLDQPSMRSYQSLVATVLCKKTNFSNARVFKRVAFD